ncbi:MAG TPA: tRNA lysidine(34) synthetase TilS, partial [Candidatus Babeliaceae bacterium]|nr:tRNA lysidine(34) synthetase TilS [Candidatus Babeliaceae bacterium]
MLYERIRAYNDKHKLIKPGDILIIGLSGGSDSVFLLHFLLWLKPEYSLTLIAVHLDHEWRTSSKEDYIFCQELAQRNNILFVGKKGSELGLKTLYKGSQEDYGRTLRRYLYERVACEYNANGIVLGHHRDDQIETFLIRLIRGSGLEGLCSMLAKDGLYIRPLLSISKQEIVEFLNTHAIEYRSDPTNESQAYL